MFDSSFLSFKLRSNIYIYNIIFCSVLFMFQLILGMQFHIICTINLVFKNKNIDVSNGFVCCLCSYLTSSLQNTRGGKKSLP